MASDGSQPFEEFIRSRTGADFVERRWLRQSIESALEPDSCRFVLVTGEPGVGKTTLMCGLAGEHRDWLRYFVDQNDGTSYVTGGRNVLSHVGRPSACLAVAGGIRRAAPESHR